MLSSSLLVLSFTSRVKHFVSQTVSMLVDLLTIHTFPNLLLSHIHILAVLHCLDHNLIQMVSLDVELMQKVVLVEIHHLF